MSKLKAQSSLPGFEKFLKENVPAFISVELMQVGNAVSNGAWSYYVCLNKHVPDLPHTYDGISVIYAVGENEHKPAL